MNQHTIKDVVSISGIGLHSGENVNLKIFPSNIDKGIELPLGLRSWSHKHTIKKNQSHVLIIDCLNIKHSNKLFGYILYPILIFPIIIRIFLYKIYFKK